MVPMLEGACDDRRLRSSGGAVLAELWYYDAADVREVMGRL